MMPYLWTYLQTSYGCDRRRRLLKVIYSETRWTSEGSRDFEKQLPVSSYLAGLARLLKENNPAVTDSVRSDGMKNVSAKSKGVVRNQGRTDRSGSLCEAHEPGESYLDAQANS